MRFHAKETQVCLSGKILLNVERQCYLSSSFQQQYIGTIVCSLVIKCKVTRNSVIQFSSYIWHKIFATVRRFPKTAKLKSKHSKVHKKQKFENFYNEYSFFPLFRKTDISKQIYTNFSEKNSLHTNIKF